MWSEDMDKLSLWAQRTTSYPPPQTCELSGEHVLLYSVTEYVAMESLSSLPLVLHVHLILSSGIYNSAGSLKQIVQTLRLDSESNSNLKIEYPQYLQLPFLV